MEESFSKRNSTAVLPNLTHLLNPKPDQLYPHYHLSDAQLNQNSFKQQYKIT